jgi:hypothetical protein
LGDRRVSYPFNPDSYLNTQPSNPSQGPESLYAAAIFTSASDSSISSQQDQRKENGKPSSDLSVAALKGKWKRFIS